MVQVMENQKPLSFTPEEIAKLKARRVEAEGKTKLTEENLLVAEIGRLYGWQAVMSVLNDEIDSHTVLWLIEAGRKVQAREQYNLASAVFIANLSAEQKKPGEAFKKNTKDLVKQMGVNNG